MSLRGAQHAIGDVSADAERAKVEGLLRELLSLPEIVFPGAKQPLQVPDNQGVYIIRHPDKTVLRVGRTHRGKAGLRQRLNDHLHNQSSFSVKYLDKKGSVLREGYTFQYIEVSDHRKRALLEYLATAWLCPKHLGLGLAKDQED